MKRSSDEPAVTEESKKKNVEKNDEEVQDDPLSSESSEDDSSESSDTEETLSLSQISEDSDSDNRIEQKEEDEDLILEELMKGNFEFIDLTLSCSIILHPQRLQKLDGIVSIMDADIVEVPVKTTETQNPTIEWFKQNLVAASSLTLKFCNGVPDFLREENGELVNLKKFIFSDVKKLQKIVINLYNATNFFNQILNLFMDDNSRIGFVRHTKLLKSINDIEVLINELPLELAHKVLSFTQLKKVQMDIAERISLTSYINEWSLGAREIDEWVFFYPCGTEQENQTTNKRRDDGNILKVRKRTNKGITVVTLSSICPRF